MIQFKYAGKIFDTSNLPKKLKKLGITESDIEIITKSEEDTTPRDQKLYHFKNKVDGSTITYIYPDLENLREYMNIDDYELC